MLPMARRDLAVAASRSAEPESLDGADEVSRARRARAPCRPVERSAPGQRSCTTCNDSERSGRSLRFPRSRGQSDYAADAATWVFSSNSTGLR